MKKSFDQFQSMTLPESMKVLGLFQTPQDYIKKNLDRLFHFEKFQRIQGSKNLFSYNSSYTDFSLLVLLFIKTNQNTAFTIVVSEANKVVYFDRNFFRNNEELLAFLQKDISKVMNIIDICPKETTKLNKDRKGNFNWSYRKKKNKV